MLQQLLPTNNLTSDPQNDFTECWKLHKTKNLNVVFIYNKRYLSDIM